jgi:hypothetical protein
VPYITSAMTDGIARPQVALTTAPIEHQKTQKNFKKNGTFFGRSKMWCNNTTLATQFTTLTPEKHHTKSLSFPKIPTKNHVPPHAKK